MFSVLGEFVDDYTVQVIDVFAMPQTGTGVSVEAVDPVFQAKMLDMLKQTGRPEMVVGWYHSHPGFGCWLSGVDINTQQSFEALSERAVAVVVDPIQSVKGKVVIDAFRLINPNMLVLGQEPRQTTSNLGHLQKRQLQPPPGVPKNRKTREIPQINGRTSDFSKSNSPYKKSKIRFFRK